MTSAAITTNHEVNAAEVSSNNNYKNNNAKAVV